jgi:hypothetical protein
LCNVEHGDLMIAGFANVQFLCAARAVHTQTRGSTQRHATVHSLN